MATRLTPTQRQLLEQFGRLNDAKAALHLLRQRIDLVDDALLVVLLATVKQHLAEGDPGEAFALAEVAIAVDRRGSLPTRIDLAMAAAEAAAHRPGRERDAIAYYAAAVKLAEDGSTPYQVPLAKAMLGQFQRVAGDLETARASFRDAVRGAVHPDARVTTEVLWNAVTLHMVVVRAIHLREPGATELASTRRAIEATLPLLPSTLVAEFNRRFSRPTDPDAPLDEWARAKALSDVVVDDVDPFDGAVMPAFLRGMAERLDERAPRHAGPGGPVARYSTNVLTDRIINAFPYLTTYATRGALERYPESLSILAHEFTHHWTYLGSVGGYFSTIATELRLLEREASDAPGIADRVRAGVADVRLKLHLLWEAWRPWAEGLALFTEMDLDLTESGDVGLPLTVFLASLPAFDVTLGSPDGKDVQEHPAPEDAAMFAAAERLQRAARAAVLPTYRWKTYLGRTDAGNETYYFTGHATTSALRRRWAAAAPPLGNSVVFLRALLWLCHAAFDDLVPDFRLPQAQFAAAVQTSFAGFLRRLFDVSPERLAEFAAICLDPGRVRMRHDLWRYLRDGTHVETLDLWDARTRALRREIAEVAAPEPDRFLAAWADQRDVLLSGLLTESRVQVIAENVAEIRLLTAGPHLACLAQPAQRGSRGMLIVRLSADEFDRLSTTARTAPGGAATLLQLLLAVPHPELGYWYVCPLAVKYASTLVLLSGTLRAGQREVTLDAAQRRAVDSAFDPDVRQFRAEIAGVVDIGTGGAAVAHARILEAFAGEIDRVYLGTIVSGTPEAIDRLCRDRLNAFLPASGIPRAQARSALDAIMRTTDGIELEALCAATGASPAGIEVVLQQISQAAATLGQDLVTRDGDRLRFVGLRAAAP